MISAEHQAFFQETIKIFEQSNYDLSTPLLSGGCFDLVAKKQVILLLVKLLENIDSLREGTAYELRKISSMLIGSPLIIGKRIRSDSEIEDGVVYSRYDIPAISLETLRSLLHRHMPPLIYAHHGGFRVKFDGQLLRQKRLEKGLSLSDLAKEVGVSKRTIYEYEREGMDVSLETAIKIEEFLDTALTVAIDLFEQTERIGSLTTPTSHQNAPKNELEREVKKHFDNIGLEDQLWTRKTPFRMLARASEPKDEKECSTTLTGITKRLSEKGVIKKIHITYSISKIAGAKPLVVVGSETIRKEIDGVPVVSVEDLLKREQKEKKTN